MAENKFNDDDRQYLQMMQDNISRMASNSANCKTWMVTILSAMLAIGCSIQDLKGWLLLAILPIAVFWYLDTFYLHLERGMRNRQLDFLLKAKKERGSADYVAALYNLAPLMKKNLTDVEKQQGYVLTNDRFLSKSVGWFYGINILLVLFITIFLNWECISSMFCCN